MSEADAVTIRDLNDTLRRSIGEPKLASNGRLIMTRGVAARGDAFVAAALRTVKDFSHFPEGDDPYGEHDFGAFNLEGEKLYWKIDYYDLAEHMGSDDPADPAKTKRVLTVLLADEY